AAGTGDDGTPPFLSSALGAAAQHDGRGGHGKLSERGRYRALWRARGDCGVDGVPRVSRCALDDRLDVAHGRRRGEVDLKSNRERRLRPAAAKLTPSRSRRNAAMPEHFDVVILGSGQGGKLLAWHLGRSGKKVAVVERRWVGGSCPAVACLPSKNELWSARVAYLVHESSRFGTLADGVRTDMAQVRKRKQDMIDREVAFHLKAYKETGAELIMGSGRFVGPRSIEVSLN